VTGIAVSAIVALARAYASAGRGGRKPAAIRLNYGIQRSENGGTAARAAAMLPLITGSWKHRGGGLLLSMSGAFPFNETKLQMPELMRVGSPGRTPRVVNMNQLGAALTEFREPPVKAMFVYNSNPAAGAPNQNAVLTGMRRDDLFMVVHDQFFTDTADYADILLPAPTFLENKDVQGSYGHRFVQITEPAITPRGEVRNNVQVFGELGRRMFPGEAWAQDSVDALIDQSLETTSTWMTGITRERLEREGHVPLALEGLPFADASWFRTPTGKGELLPVPEYVAPVESRAVEVFNARGKIALRVKLSGKVGKGVVAARLDWNKLGGDLSGRGANVNALTSERLTDIGGGATFYSTLVEVRKTVGRGEFDGA
jgi:anaerobic selenocysteine-containing dehydrogenase